MAVKKQSKALTAAKQSAKEKLFLEKEIDADHKKQKRSEKAFGKERIHRLQVIFEATGDLVMAHFTKKEIESVMVTIDCKLKSGEQWGRTSMQVDMPGHIRRPLKAKIAKAWPGKGK